MPLPIQPFETWSALDYSTIDENFGVIFEAFSVAGIPGAWLPAAAHIMLEVGNFKKFTAAWNYGNIKYFGNARGATFLVNFNDDNPDDLFLGFDDPQTGIAEYVRLIKVKYGIDGTENGERFAQKLKAKGYATDPNFVKKVADKYSNLIASRPDLLTWAGSPSSNTAGSNILGIAALLLLGSILLNSNRQ